MRLACRTSSRRRDLGTLRGAYLVKRGCRGSLGLGRAMKGVWGGGSGGCVVVAELRMEGLHLFHANVVRSVELQFVHEVGWV